MFNFAHAFFYFSPPFDIGQPNVLTHIALRFVNFVFFSEANKSVFLLRIFFGHSWWRFTYQLNSYSRPCRHRMPIIFQRNRLTAPSIIFVSPRRMLALLKRRYFACLFRVLQFNFVNVVICAHI